MKPRLVLSLFGLFYFLSVDARKCPATAIGRVFCRINGISYPVEYVRVRLKDEDFVHHDTLGSTRSDSSGRFTVSTATESACDQLSWPREYLPQISDIFDFKPDPFIEVEYDYSGNYGKMAIKFEFVGIIRRDQTPTKSYSNFIDFGDIYFSSDHCRAYVMTYRAMKNYVTLSGKFLPYSRLKVITQAPVHGGTPYATTETIRIPSGYNYDFASAKHELAHTVRHSLDGTFAHFLFDVIRFAYPQTHYCGKQTNEGFAFNEGWAEFWEARCFGSYGTSLTDYSYEGNVAKALRALKSRCGSSYGQMVEVLEENPGRIHSFEQYAAAHHTLYGCK